MDVVVVGKHAEVDAALRALTLEKLERIDKFANDVRRIDVDYERAPDAPGRRLAHVRDPRARATSTS